MSSDLLKELSGVELRGGEEFQQALEEIREDRQDYETFFEDVFKRLEATLTEAVQEQLTWEQQRERKENEFAQRLAEIERQSRELEIQRERFLADSIAAVQEQFQLQSQKIDLSAVSDLESSLKSMLENAGREREGLQEALASTASQADRLTSVAKDLTAAQEQFRQQIQDSSQVDLSAVNELESRLKTTLEEACREREALQDILASTTAGAERLTSVADALATAQEQARASSQADLSAVGELESDLKSMLEGAGRERQELQDALASAASQATQLASVAEALSAAQKQVQESGRADISAVGELETKLKATLKETARERQALQDALFSTDSQAQRLESVAEALSVAQEQFQQQTQANSRAEKSALDELESRLKSTLEEVLSSGESQSQRLASVTEALSDIQEQIRQQAEANNRTELSAVDELESRLKTALEEAGRDRKALQEVLASSESQAERLTSVADTLAAAQDLFQRQAAESGQADMMVVGELESRLKTTLEEAGRERKELQDALASTVSQTDKLSSVAEALTAAQAQFQEQMQQSGKAELSAVSDLESRLQTTLEEAGRERKELQDALASTASQADRLSSVAEELSAAQEQFQKQIQQSGKAELSAMGELESRLQATLEEAGRERKELQDALTATASQADRLTSVAEALNAAQEQFLKQPRDSGKADLSAVGELESRLQATLEEAGRERKELQDALAATASQAEQLTSVAEALSAAQEQFLKQPQPSGSVDLSAVGELESSLKTTLEEAGQDRQALQAALTSTDAQAERLSSLAESLAAAQEQFQRQIEQREDANTTGAQGASGEVLLRMQQLEEERAELLQGRSVLEAELESVRQRAVDLMTALEYQKSLASEQQNQLNDEQKRQRQLLEQMLGRLAELEISSTAAPNMPAPTASTPGASAPAASAPPAGPTPAEADSVLSSVMSQFEVLQKDIARRRNKNSN